MPEDAEKAITGQAAVKVDPAEAVHAQRLAGTPDLTKIAVGTFPPLGGMPADNARARILDRAGVPRQTKAADGSSAVHPLRAGLLHTHPATQAKDVPRLPDVFPPADYTGPLASAQDWLTLIDDVMAPVAQTVAEAAPEEGQADPAKTSDAPPEQTVPKPAVPIEQVSA